VKAVVGGWAESKSIGGKASVGEDDSVGSESHRGRVEAPRRGFIRSRTNLRAEDSTRTKWARGAKSSCRA